MARKDGPELSILKGAQEGVGGVDLREALSRRQPPATVHTTDFHQCFSEFICLLDEEMKVTGYRLMIKDPVERHVYNFDFPQQVRDGWLETLKQFPDEGQKLNPDTPVLQ